jgi:GntR family transcriptional regulator, transcriptional repressor for pyruvate dehydrogenase complex
MAPKKRGKKLIEHIRKIEVQKPADLIIEQIKDLITTGVLKPGDRLPSEPSLARAFEVSRGQVREALKQLEFYGVLTTVPQSGTFVASMGVRSLEGVISNILHFQKEDFESLSDTRAVLEIHAAELAAVRASDEEIAEILQAQQTFCEHRKEGGIALDDDIFFHLKLAEYTHSSFLASLITLLAPDIIKQNRRFEKLRKNNVSHTVEEHQRIVEGIQAKDPQQARRAMADHMQHTLLVGKTLSYDRGDNPGQENENGGMDSGR